MFLCILVLSLNVVDQGKSEGIDHGFVISCDYLSVEAVLAVGLENSRKDIVCES